MIGAVATVSLFSGACATKKHVRESIAPVQQQLNDVSGKLTDVSKKTGENTTSIGDLDRNLARTEEHAMEADRKAGTAGEAARLANDNATQAGQSANRANQLAQQSMDRTMHLENAVNNLDNYKLLSIEKVYFGVNRYELSKEDKDKLDQAVQPVAAAKSFVIEVAGFTDRTGSRAKNLELSRRRAEAVVRYLTVDKNIPLRRIHDVGVGPDFPNAVNRTASDRKENRRVDVRIFMLDAPGSGTQLQSMAQPPKG